MAAVNPIPKFVSKRFEIQFTPDIPRHWNAGDPVKSHFANAFSVLLPGYERLFIAAIAGQSKGIANPELRDQAKAFCVQEGQHAAIHRGYNRWLESLGYSSVRSIERVHQWLLGLTQRLLSKKSILALAAGGEHITSFMAHEFLAFPDRWTAEADPRIAALWKWHAAEEIEHKAVCFDVYRERSDKLWVRRMFFLVAIAQTLAFVSWGLVAFLYRDGLLFKRKTWVGIGTLFFGEGGFVTGVLREGARYLKRDFHPWDIQDAELVERWAAGRA